MKKIVLVLQMLLLIIGYSANAEEVDGRVVLDLKDDSYFAEVDTSNIMPTIISKGIKYVRDVKQYNEQLDGDNIEKNFSEDIKSKYPSYSDVQAEVWQRYVRKGVKVYRFYENIKNKVKKWVLEYELPIVVDDDQYEMGENEKYIESDEPLIIEKFKKVVAYSDSPRDRLAAREKRAKDLNLPLPSRAIKWYRENIMQGNWKKLIKGIWKDGDFEEKKDNDGAKKQLDRASYMLMMKYNGIAEDGEFEGIIDVNYPKGKFVLLSDYKQYKGIRLNFSDSDNVQKITTYFVLPQAINLPSEQQILFYGSGFPVYFKGIAKDSSKPVVIRAKCLVNLCLKDVCEENYDEITLKVNKVDELKKTSYAGYITVVANNVPRNKYEKYFDVKGAFWDKRENESLGIQVTFSSKHTDKAKIFMIGENAKFFAPSRMSINNGRVTAWFKLLDKNFSREGQKGSFWISEGSGKQYIANLDITEPSIFDAQSGEFSLGVFCLAFLGGMLLNLMPCVFPVLALKLLALVKLSGHDSLKVRRNFIYNSLGIMVTFWVLACCLLVLKYLGFALGWGMQFQSVTFLALIIWVVTYFLAYVLGIFEYYSFDFAHQFIRKQEKKDFWFEFLSGVMVVVLSTPCMAPYLGTALGIALAGSYVDIMVTLTGVGLGLIVPYVLIALFPKLVVYMPKSGKWLANVNRLMIVMLIITLGWLISVLSAQTSGWMMVRWIMYIVAALSGWTFYHILQKKVDELSDGEDSILLKKQYRNWCLGLTFILIAISVFDAKVTEYKGHEQVFQSRVSIDYDYIKSKITRGKKVLVKVGADWCLTCKYNDYMVLGWDYMQDELVNNNIEVINVDWTDYNEQVLYFMRKFGRQGIPFYVYFSKDFPEGIVLPEILEKHEMLNLMRK